MSVNITLSNSKQVNCNNIESGCLITLGKEYNTKYQVNKIWNTIKNIMIVLI